MTHGHASLDLGQFDHDQRYKFLMASVVPRPIALVTSLGEDGVLNAAPFSSYVVLSIDPPMLGISVAFRDDGACKDTRRNIERSGEFVINSVTADMVAQVQQCGQPYPSDVSEAQAAGLTPIASHVVSVPRIAQSPLQFECRLRHCVEFGQRRSALLVGEVVLAHAAAGLAQAHRVDPAVLNAVGRLAGTTYCRVSDTISV